MSASPPYSQMGPHTYGLPDAHCSCGMHATVFGEVPDPGCPIHGDRGVNAWSTCWACGRNVRHAVGHKCEASDA